MYFRRVYQRVTSKIDYRSYHNTVVFNIPLHSYRSSIIFYLNFTILYMCRNINFLYLMAIKQSGVCKSLDNPMGTPYITCNNSPLPVPSLTFFAPDLWLCCASISVFCYTFKHLRNWCVHLVSLPLLYIYFVSAFQIQSSLGVLYISGNVFGLINVIFFTR